MMYVENLQIQFLEFASDQFLRVGIDAALQFRKITPLQLQFLIDQFLVKNVWRIFFLTLISFIIIKPREISPILSPTRQNDNLSNNSFFFRISNIYWAKLVPQGNKNQNTKNTKNAWTRSWLYTGMNISESLISGSRFSKLNFPNWRYFRPIIRTIQD